MSKKLREICDIQNMVNREKVFRLTMVTMLIVFLTVLTGMAGLYLGSLSRLANLTYPFMLAGELPVALSKKRIVEKYGLLVPLVAFIAGFMAGQLLPAYPTLQNVFEWSQIKRF